ncbi:hypothetical protein C8Q78DRAFT_185864 [Trametes maxima]|nr:hypothetical protein C8Q78DRAFT_185864 [Trametes maxima]
MPYGLGCAAANSWTWADRGSTLKIYDGPSSVRANRSSPSWRGGRSGWIQRTSFRGISGKSISIAFAIHRQCRRAGSNAGSQAEGERHDAGRSTRFAVPCASMAIRDYLYRHGNGRAQVRFARSPPPLTPGSTNFLWRSSTTHPSGHLLVSSVCQCPAPSLEQRPISLPTSPVATAHMIGAASPQTVAVANRPGHPLRAVHILQASSPRLDSRPLITTSSGCTRYKVWASYKPAVIPGITGRLHHQHHHQPRLMKSGFLWEWLDKSEGMASNNVSLAHSAPGKAASLIDVTTKLCAD